MTKEEYNSFIEENNLDIDSSILITYNDEKTELVSLYKKYAYEVEDRLSYPDQNIVHGQPAQILTIDVSLPTGVRGILLEDVSHVEAFNS
jgi:hypothetical protein